MMSKTLYLYNVDRTTKGSIAQGETFDVGPLGGTHVHVIVDDAASVFIPGDAMFEILEDETNE